MSLYTIIYRVLTGYLRIDLPVNYRLRYIDDTFTAVHKDGMDDFHEHLNRQNADADKVHQGDQRRKR